MERNCVKLRNRALSEYRQGIKDFLDFVFEHTTMGDKKKMIWDLGLDYVKIDACENNCMLYWKENSNRVECQVCGISRWKSSEGSVRGNKVPHKVLRYSQ